ncbi:TetR family transcriptional regulator [Nocardioides pacificus]
MSEAANDTRRRMVEVAERLFAEHGTAAVSLRMVGQEAGQRNNSAAQYHFGDRQGLIDAIVQLRTPPIDARRAEMTAQLGSDPDVRSLLRVLVQPLAESAAAPGPRTHYLGFLANVMDDYPPSDQWEVSQVQPASFQRIVIQLGEALPHLPPKAFERRMRWVARVSLRLLADHEPTLAQARDRPEETAEILHDLVEMLAALLEGPVGAVGAAGAGAAEVLPDNISVPRPTGETDAQRPDASYTGGMGDDSGTAEPDEVVQPVNH